MASMEPRTGREVRDLAEISQSVAQIVTTPKGSRVMQREFGFEADEIQDTPGHPSRAITIIAVMADAISRWENRVAVENITVTPGYDGRTRIVTRIRVKSNGLTANVTTPFVGGAA
jgi:phage baseplate assembly protein W